MTKSQIFLYCCLSFITGIFISSLGPEPIINYGFGRAQIFVLGFLILGIFLICVFWQYKKLVVAGFCLIFLVAGVWRHQTVEIQSSNLKIQNTGETVNLVGVVKEEPVVGEKSTKLTIKTELGKVLVTVDRYPEYQYGDKLKVTGKLMVPPAFEGFNYQDYLKKDGIYSVMNWPQIELLDSGLGNPAMAILFSFKNKFEESARKFISPPQQGILEALIFGDEAGLSQDWKNKFNLTGTRHIMAVSGMNISIVASLFFSLALGFGLWRKHAFYLSIFLLTFYILMVGAPASALRAGLMGGILLTSQYLGRLSSATRSVVFAATIMLFFNPLLLKLDIGFQLSFLAVLGIIYLQPSFSNWLRRLPDPKIFPLKSALATTFSAQIFTLPILIYNFGYIPLISPITNILIVPFLAPITIMIFIFGIFAMVFWPLGYVLSWPTWLSLTYIVSVIDVFSKIPLASLAVRNIHWFWLPICWLILGFLAWRLNKKQKIW